MIVKSKHVRVSRVSQGQASSALSSHLKYLQYRERDPARETVEDRHFFNDEEDHVDRRAAHSELMREPAGDIYYHRIILSPAQDEPVEDWREWNPHVVLDLGEPVDHDLEMACLAPPNNYDPHIH